MLQIVDKTNYFDNLRIGNQVSLHKEHWDNDNIEIMKFILESVWNIKPIIMNSKLF